MCWSSCSVTWVTAQCQRLPSVPIVTAPPRPAQELEQLGPGPAASRQTPSASFERHGSRAVVRARRRQRTHNADYGHARLHRLEGRKQPEMQSITSSSNTPKVHNVAFMTHTNRVCDTFAASRQRLPRSSGPCWRTGRSDPGTPAPCPWSGRCGAWPRSRRPRPHDPRAWARGAAG